MRLLWGLALLALLTTCLAISLDSRSGGAAMPMRHNHHSDPFTGQDVQNTVANTITDLDQPTHAAGPSHLDPEVDPTDLAPSGPTPPHLGTAITTVNQPKTFRVVPEAVVDREKMYDHNVPMHLLPKPGFHHHEFDHAAKHANEESISDTISDLDEAKALVVPRPPDIDHFDRMVIDRAKDCACGKPGIRQTQVRVAAFEPRPRKIIYYRPPRRHIIRIPRPPPVVLPVSHPIHLSESVSHPVAQAIRHAESSAPPPPPIVEHSEHPVSTSHSEHSTHSTHSSHSSHSTHSSHVSESVPELIPESSHPVEQQLSSHHVSVPHHVSHHVQRPVVKMPVVKHPAAPLPPPPPPVIHGSIIAPAPPPAIPAPPPPRPLPVYKPGVGLVPPTPRPIGGVPVPGHPLPPTPGQPKPIVHMPPPQPHLPGTAPALPSHSSHSLAIGHSSHSAGGAPKPGAAPKPGVAPKPPGPPPPPPAGAGGCPGFHGPYTPSGKSTYTFPHKDWTVDPMAKDIWIVFEASCINDASIMLSPHTLPGDKVDTSPEKGDLHNRYQIIIGGWKNKYSAIRKHNGGRNMVRHYHVLPICEGKPKKFWVRFLHGTISVGTGPWLDHERFMTWRDGAPLPVHHFDFGMWDKPVTYFNIYWGTGGERIPHRYPLPFTGYSPRNRESYYSFYYHDYHRYPIVKEMWISFQARCESDIHVLLSTLRLHANGKDDIPDRYEIVIGGKKNTLSEIRRHVAGPAKSSAADGKCEGFIKPTQFWIKFLDGLITVGHGPIFQKQFMVWKDPAPLNISYFDLGRGSHGHVIYNDVYRGTGCIAPVKEISGFPNIKP